MLVKFDPLSKNKINSNDTQRAIRAYEIKKYTKKSLFEWFNKTKSNHYITGDDLSQTIFQHSIQFEPTFVFPYVTYFAEATNSELYLLPFKQFLLVKNNNFKIHDLTQGKIYNNTSVKWQLFKKKYNY